MPDSTHAPTPKKAPSISQRTDASAPKSNSPGRLKGPIKSRVVKVSVEGDQTKITMPVGEERGIQKGTEGTIDGLDQDKQFQIGTSAVGVSTAFVKHTVDEMRTDDNPEHRKMGRTVSIG